jgi:hypothetical protein
MRFVPDIPATPRYWQVCFMGVDRRFWWDRFLPLGFRHVFLLGYVPEHRLWICYDVLFFKTEITLLSGERAGFLLTLAEQEGEVLTWPAPVDARPTWWLRLGMWCVPAAQHVLGVRCVAITPKGLHDYLVRRGAKPLVEDQP